MESKFEQTLERWRKRCCDWGLMRPIKPKDGPWEGGPAPVWNSPSQLVVFLAAVINIIIFIATLIANIQITGLYGDCDPIVIALKNLIMFYFFITSLFMLYMSKVKRATDKQWSRYIALSSISSIVLLFIDGGLYAVTIGVSTCQSDDKQTYDLSVAFAVLGTLVLGVNFAVILWLTVKLYLATSNYIAYSV